MKKRARRREGKIRVMIVDDHARIREALKNIIDAEAGLVVVAEADGGRAAIDLFERNRPDVILMDGSMPEMNGIETTRRLKHLEPKVKIIGLTLYSQSTYLEEMVAVGASGYLVKTGSPENVINAIRIVGNGGTYLDPAVPRCAAAVARKGSSTQKLTTDEMAVAKLLANGQTNSEIADSLGLKIQAVETRRAAAVKKLGVHTRAELVRLAADRHWFDD
jgi:two-component system, NarL family, response regulator NreC